VEEPFANRLLQLDVKVTGSGYCPRAGVRIVDAESSGSATTMRVCVFVCVYIYIVTRWSDYRRGLDRSLELFYTFTVRDYTSQITSTHRLVFSVMLLSNSGCAFGLRSLLAGNFQLQLPTERLHLNLETELIG
jgi:hypothetical protein